jgi:hypothetical protein
MTEVADLEASLLREKELCAEATSKVLQLEHDMKAERELWRSQLMDASTMTTMSAHNFPESGPPQSSGPDVDVVRAQEWI